MKFDKKQIKIICDFDGTVSIGDVGDLFFLQFSNSDTEDLVKQWESGQIDSKQMYLSEIEKLHISQHQLDDFLIKQKIDPAFASFVEFCEESELPIVIVSDGMDIYIRPILKRNGLGHLPVYSNILYWDSESRLTVEFPYYEFACGKCANCKGYQVRNLRDKNKTIIFIGDGISDTCAVEEADIVLAKGYLQKYCLDRGIPCVFYQDFADVLKWFKDYLKTNDQ